MAELADIATDPVEASIEQLLTLAKKRGFLTWEEMNAILPDEAISPDKLEMVMMRLEQNEIEMVDEAEADRLGVREDTKDARPKKSKRKPIGDEEVDLEKAQSDDGGSRRIDDPVRMYLTQMGEIPLLTRPQEIALAKKIELTRMAFRKQVLESDYCA
ncbi:MAG: RNA polymerase subunit sigma-70, partial [Phycisphaerae bacterium]|nr:RNA polymerase subunit sigma-70 [Phycisphaerae bacterium]